MSTRVDHIDLEEPSRVVDGRYELGRMLGRGSTGTVWEAMDRVSAEIVAVKILHRRLLASPSAGKRFLREVESAGKLRHPHSVEVRAHGNTIDGDLYLVMERLLGTTLAACLSETGRLTQMRAVRIVAQILEAVGAAHRMQIVHRDLKPGNLMLIDRDGNPDFVKVCDFGLATAIDRDAFAETSVDGGLAHINSIVTAQGEICGTPEYMAPEQARGESIDGRADLYAIAALLYHAVVGELPFRGSSPLAVVSLHLSAPPPRPSTIHPEIGIFPPLENLIMRGLAKDRTERPSSADVFRAELLQIERDFVRAGGERSTRPAATPRTLGGSLPAAPSRSARWRQATPRFAIGSFAVGGALCTAVFLWCGSANDPGRLRLAGSRVVDQNPAATIRAAPQEVRASRAPLTLGDPSMEIRSASVAASVAGSDDAPRGDGSQDGSRHGRFAPVRARPSLRGAEIGGDPVAAAAVPEPPPPDGFIDEAEDVLARGRIAEACVLGERAAGRSPESGRVWAFLGRCYMRLGEPDRARTCYRKYLSMTPSASDAMFVQAMIAK